MRDESEKVIDDQKRAQDALRATEESFRLIVDSIPGLVSTTTATGEVELINQQTRDFFGKTVEELRNWAALVHPDDRARVLAVWSRALEVGQPYGVEHRIRRAD